VGDNIVIEQVLVLFLVIMVGFVAKKRGLITEEVSQKLSGLLLYVTMPFMIIVSFHVDFSAQMLRNAGVIFALGVAAHVFSIVLGKLLFYKFPDSINRVMRFGAVFSNCAFMGFPVIDGLFGRDGIFFASMYIAVFHIFIWTYGIGLFSGGFDFKDTKKMLKSLINPGIVSVAAGLMIFVLQIKLPDPLYQALDMLGGMTTPISMMVVGALLADADFKKVMFKWHLYYGVLVRLLLIPLLVFLILRLFVIPPMLLGITVVLTAMPIAVNTAIFAEKYGGDAALASQYIALSTALSIITIPAIILLI
jgi:predicted permease